MLSRQDRAESALMAPPHTRGETAAVMLLRGCQECGPGAVPAGARGKEMDCKDPSAARLPRRACAACLCKCRAACITVNPCGLWLTTRQAPPCSCTSPAFACAVRRGAARAAAAAARRGATVTLPAFGRAVGCGRAGARAAGAAAQRGAASGAPSWARSRAQAAPPASAGSPCSGLWGS